MLQRKPGIGWNVLQKVRQKNCWREGRRQNKGNQGEEQQPSLGVPWQQQIGSVLCLPVWDLQIRIGWSKQQQKEMEAVGMGQGKRKRQCS